MRYASVEGEARARYGEIEDSAAGKVARSPRHQSAAFEVSQSQGLSARESNAGSVTGSSQRQTWPPTSTKRDRRCWETSALAEAPKISIGGELNSDFPIQLEYHDYLLPPFRSIKTEVAEMETVL